MESSLRVSVRLFFKLKISRDIRSYSSAAACRIWGMLEPREGATALAVFSSTSSSSFMGLPVQGHWPVALSCFLMLSRSNTSLPASE